MKGIFDGSETLIVHGAQADVYSFKGFAYKVYKQTYPKEWIEFEKSQQTQVNKAGLSKVKYYDTDDPHIVKMDLIEGDTLEKKMREGYPNGFELLADAFRTVHKADVSDIKMPTLMETAGMGLTDEEKDTVLPIIKRLSEKMSTCICHLDMHFLNVMLPNDGSDPIIIDWINARIAPAVFDYARTYAILEQAPEGVLELYKKVVLPQIFNQGVSESDFSDALEVSRIIRSHEVKN